MAILPIFHYKGDALRKIADDGHAVIGAATDGRELTQKLQDLCYAMGAASDMRAFLQELEAFDKVYSFLSKNMRQALYQLLYQSRYVPKAGDIVLPR